MISNSGYLLTNQMWKQLKKKIAGQGEDSREWGKKNTEDTGWLQVEDR